MSKHSLIATGLGLGLMAASMGASAQLHTFDYSSMYYGAVAGGSKYVSFVPTLVRGGANTGAAGVLMLEMFQPVSGSASTWAYALGGAVDAAAGGSNTDGVYQSVSFSADNGLGVTQSHYFGNNGTISHAFSQSVTVSSQACQVTFAAHIGTNDQLAFTNVFAKPLNSISASDVVSLTTSGTGTVTIGSAAWNNASAAIVSSYAANASLSISGLLSATSTGAGDTVTYAASGTAVNGLLGARGRCVPAYTARAAGSGTTITGETIGLVRIY